MTFNIVVMHLGYALNLASLAVRDVLWLRSIMLVSQGLLGFASFWIANYNVFFWNSVFIMVNAYHVVRIARERQPIPLPADIQDIYEEVFAAMTRREFLNFWLTGHVEEVRGPLVEQGSRPERIMMVLEGSASVRKGGRELGRLGRKRFIAEMSFLTGDPASADVVAEQPVMIIGWEQSKLRSLSRLNPSLLNRLNQILGRDVVRKVKDLPAAAQAAER